MSGLLLSRLSSIWKRKYLWSWGLGITVVMVVVLWRFFISWRWNNTLRSCDSGFLGLLVITSFIENDSESFSRGRISRIPFPKFWQWSRSISLVHTTKKETELFIIKNAEFLNIGNGNNSLSFLAKVWDFFKIRDLEYWNHINKCKMNQKLDIRDG